MKMIGKEDYENLLFMAVLIKYLSRVEVSDSVKFDVVNKYIWN
jgi:hypothetical protein